GGRRNRHRSAEMATAARQAREFRQRVKREIHFAGRTAVFVALHFFDEIARQLARFDEFQEREPWIDARRNDLRVNLFAALERHALRDAILDDDPRYRRFRADFGSRLPRGAADGIRNSTRAAS